VNRRRDWFAGVVVGAWTGFSLVYVAIVGAVLFVGFVVGAAIGRSMVAIGGQFIGAGAVILLMLALANANCDSGCTPPDLTGWLVAGSAMATVGSLITVVAIVGPR
jgi:hypothetical protein